VVRQPDVHDTDDDPDPRLLWRWFGKATRPWVGWVFIGIGGLLVLLGYLGVSRESIVEKQIPFLVSGGIGGVLLCVVGAYFLGTEELRKDSGRLDRLEAMVQELHRALLVDREGAPKPVVPDAVGNGHAPELIAVVGGETFHRSDCVMASGKEVESVTAGSATSRNLQPCPLCEPVPA
jgi:hypothetical protein